MIDTFAIRCNVLKLAFSGQLSQHEVEDGAIDDLLKRVNPNREIKQSEAGPYEIPENWAWVKLEDLYAINPKVEAADDTDAAFIPMERISAGFSDSFTFEVQKWSAASKNHTRFADGDVAFAKISPCFENRKSFIATGLPNGIGGGTTELIILRQKEMLPRFTYYVTLDQRFIHEGVASYKGTVGQQRVKSDVIKNYMVAVPPKEEQQRIIEKIESIFSALDTIDTLQGQYQDNLATLKSKIIDAGIQGKLTEQLLEDGTAEELYQQIQQERKSQEASGKIKKEDLFPDIEDQSIPFSVPKTWLWTYLGNVSYIVRGGSPRPIKQYITHDTNGINWIKIGDVEKGGKYIYQTNERISPEGEKKSRRVYPGDFLLTNSMSFGRPYISQIEGCIHDGWLLIRNLNGFDPDYLYYLLSSSYLYGQFTEKASGSTVDNLNIDKVKSAMIPLPPLAEQKRIVAKLEELLPLCEKG